MSLDEIYGELAAHMVKGLMYHDQLSHYFAFLNEDSHADKHREAYLKESKAYSKFCKYYICHHGKLVPEQRIDNPNVIPSSWRKYTKEDVDDSTRVNGVNTALDIWVNWERDTKALYSKMYNEFVNMGAVADAMFLCDYIRDVDHELAQAMHEKIEYR